VAEQKRGVLIRCPQDHKPQFAINENGIEHRCRSCHLSVRIDWATIDRIRADLAAGREVLAEQQETA
jgi:hypothetical protein